MSGKHGKRNLALLITAGLAAAALAGCGADCQEARRTGDFEYSQGNFAAAVRHYERALKEVPSCAGVKEKLAEAKSRNP